MSRRGCELIVAGFHRSGTSSVAQVLQRAGLFVGERLVGAMPYNPYGHYEDREVVSIHDRILADNGWNWQVDRDLVPLMGRVRWMEMERLIQRRRIHHRLWGFKDPRACLFLPQWKHLMPDVKVLAVFRRVGDCCASLQRRHARELFERAGPAPVHRRFFSVPDLAARMWLVHNRALVSFARRYPQDVLVIGFDSVLRGVPLTRLLRTAWGLPLADVPTLSTIDPLVTGRRDAPQPLSDPGLAAELDELSAQLRALERDTLALV
jgi:hypothetical protein